jgi:predicted nuclease of predicted toxin-antitoxin system
VRLLLDEHLPVDLATELTGHEVDTVVGLGWQGITNGELLRRASGRFDALVTMDRNIEFQQNLAVLPFGIILLSATSNRMAHLQPLVPAILTAIQDIAPGTVQRIGA